MSLITKIIIILIVVHLVVGFGWLIYKLGPTKYNKDKEQD